MLRVTNLHTGYGPLRILNGVSIEVDDSETVGLIGPNGAGKSTCFKAIFGLIDVWQGEVVFNGEDITDLSPDRTIQRGICYVMQGHEIFPQMTIEENLEMGGYTVSSGEIETRMEDVLALFPPLADRTGEKARTLSGGQKKMLEIGMALMCDPDLILLDEPSLGLAPAVREDVFGVVADLVDQEDLSFLIIEQNVRQLLENVDRAYVLEQGSVRTSGTGQELLDSDEIVELYIGKPV